MKWNLFPSLIAFLLLWYTAGQAQPGFERIQAPVSANGDPFLNPFTGGLNNPQLNKVDLNNDGVEDLLVFDRNGNLPMTFLFTGQPGEVAYTYAPEYAANFPAMVNWVLLRDYDGDGIQDIFAHYPAPINGIIAYRGYFDAGNKIAFELYPFWEGYPECIYFEQINGSKTPIYVNNVDYPVVTDVDGDGDLDVLTFNPAGGWVDYLQNRSVQLGYGRDSLIFKKADFCWGKFYEASFSEDIVLSPDPNQCATGLTGDPDVNNRHPGSTLVTFDADNDGDLEIAIGDINYGKINFLTNGGTPQSAWMIEQDSDFPAYDVPVNIPVFPVPFILDLDNDGKDDFLAAPNNVGGTPNYEVVWFYRNVNTQEEPIFELVRKNALVDEMLDFGGWTHPVFLDIDADGLMDLLVGTDGYYDESLVNNRDPRLVLLRNIGTQTEPAFDLIDDDFLDMSQYSNETWNFAPAAGDLDNDGDTDLLIGEQDGRLFFFENVAGAGNPAQFAPIQFNWMGIDVGQNSHPAIADLNRDGKPDLVVGERNGNFNYFENTGTAEAPFFTTDPTNPLFGNVSTELPGDFSAGNSAPVLLDYEDTFLMVAGTQVGPLQVYTDIENNLSGTFTLVNPNLGDTKEGKRSTAAFADLDGDGYLEMVVGNNRGGLSLFTTPLDVTAGPSSAFDRSVVQPTRIYPNPARDQITLEWPGKGAAAVEVRLYNALGQWLRTDQASGQEWTLPVAELQPGLYMFVISGRDGQRAAIKWVKH
jgi:hypothetical protein